jgi:hypothetical protein
MKTLSSFPISMLVLTLALLLRPIHAQTLGTAFTFQGRLIEYGSPATSLYDLQFRLYDALTSGQQVGSVFTVLAVPVSNGLFTAVVDFGPQIFTGTNFWLEVAVRQNGSVDFGAPLQPRHRLTGTPYALYAANAGSAKVATSASAVAALSVTGDGIQNGTITATKIGSGQLVKSLNGLTDTVTLSAGTNVIFNPSGNNIQIAASTGNDWRLAGNAGTDPSTSFLGTTDSRPLVFKTGGLEAMRIDVARNVGIGTTSPTRQLQLERTGDVEIGLRSRDAGGRLWTIQSSGDGFPGRESSFQIIDRSIPAARLLINSNGWVGIGTISPAALLDVAGTVSAGTMSAGSYLWGSSSLFSDQGGAVELGNSLSANFTPYFDFHYGVGSNQDFNVRLINDADGRLTLAGNLNVTGTVKAASFMGSGAGLTGVPDGALSANVPKLNANQTFSGLVTLSNATGAPFAVGSSAKVNSLNADLLDGVDSTGLWQLGGNSGTTPGTHFLGTTDANALELKVNGARALRLEPTTNSPNVIGGAHVNFVTAGVVAATIGGGGSTNLSGFGYTNIVSGHFGTIGGGGANTISSTGQGSVIAGGIGNMISGQLAMVPGGLTNVATGNFSFAAGRRAKADHQGAFVWADSQDAEIISTAINQVTFRCAGGVRFTSGSGGGNQIVSWAPGNSSWTFTSDARLKENFKPVDSQTVLDKLCGLPIAEWNFKGYSAPHIGPTAQDFHARFPLGGSPEAIDSGDLHGVALAAIQGLNQKLEAALKQKDAELRELRGTVAELKGLVERLTKNE